MHGLVTFTVTLHFCWIFLGSWAHTDKGPILSITICFSTPPVLKVSPQKLRYKTNGDFFSKAFYINHQICFNWRARGQVVSINKTPGLDQVFIKFWRARWLRRVQPLQFLINDHNLKVYFQEQLTWIMNKVSIHVKYVYRIFHMLW